MLKSTTRDARATGVAAALLLCACSCNLGRSGSGKSSPASSGGDAAVAGDAAVDVPEDLVRLAEGRPSGGGRTSPEPLPRRFRRPPEVRVKIYPPTEVRLKIYWANSKGQVIHAPGKPFPDEWSGVVVPLSAEGAHLVTKVNKLQVRDHAQLTQTLVDLLAANPSMPVVIDARRAVPFEHVFKAVEACRRAKVKKVLFQAPPVEGDGGGWLWR